MSIAKETVEFTLMARQGRQFVLQSNDGQELSVPIHCIPKGLRLGQTVLAEFMTSETREHSRQTLAVELLNQLLKVEK